MGKIYRIWALTKTKKTKNKLGKFFSVSNELSVEQPYSLSLSFKNDLSLKPLRVWCLLKSVPRPAGQTSPRHAQLFPSLPIRAHSFPSLPFVGLAPIRHMRSIGHASGKIFSFGPLALPDALMRVIEQVCIHFF